MPIKIFIVEDHTIVRDGLKSLLKGNSEVEVVGEASNGAETFWQLEECKPQVVIMDLIMPVMGGLEATKRLKKEYPEIKILVLSMHDHESYLIDMLEAGADGYLLKNSSKNELVFAIKRLAEGGMYMAPEFTVNMMAKYKMSMGHGLKTEITGINLSDREQDVLNLIAEGYTNLEIANKLFTSVRTIETRRKKFLIKPVPAIRPRSFVLPLNTAWLTKYYQQAHPY